MANTSTTSTSTSHPQHLESFGTHCNLKECNISDFLPFKCPYCTLSFCGDHRLPSSHSCTSPSAYSQERTATSCPLCGEVLPISDLAASSIAGAEGEGEVADRAMELHLDKGKCRAMQTDSHGILLSPEAQAAKTARLKADNNECTYARCRNKMWIKLRCETCGKGFCPTHREARAHKCEAEQRARSSTPISQSQATKDQTGKDSSTSGLFGKLKSGNRDKPDGNNSNSSPTSPSTTANPTRGQSGRAPLPAAKQPSSPPSRQAHQQQSAVSQSLTGSSGLMSKLNQKSEEKTISKRAAAEQQAALLSLRHRAEKG